MKSKLIRIISVFAALALFLSACGSTSQDPLAGTAWNLVSLAGDPLVAGSSISATFKDGQISGGACNSYSGSYTVKGDTITFGPIASTEMYCMDPEGAMDQESTYFALLQHAQTFEITANQLTIFNSEGAALVFEPATAP